MCAEAETPAMILDSFTYTVSSVLSNPKVTHTHKHRERKSLWWQSWLSKEGSHITLTSYKDKNRREGWQRGSSRAEQSVKGVMRNNERGEEKEMCVWESEGTPAVCLPCTREGCVKPAEMTEQTRAATRNTDNGLRTHTLKGVCAHLSYAWVMLNRCTAANLSRGGFLWAAISNLCVCLLVEKMWHSAKSASNSLHPCDLLWNTQDHTQTYKNILSH